MGKAGLMHVGKGRMLGLGLGVGVGYERCISWEDWVCDGMGRGGEAVVLMLLLVCLCFCKLNNHSSRRMLESGRACDLPHGENASSELGFINFALDLVEAKRDEGHLCDRSRVMNE